MSTDTSLNDTLAATLYLQRVQALSPAVEMLRSDAQQMFAEQGYDVLWGLYQGGGFSESSREDKRRAAAVLAAIVALLEKRLSRDVQHMHPGLSEALAISLARGSLARYGISAGLRSISAEHWIAEHGAELVKGLNTYTREVMSSLLARGFASGKSLDEIAVQLVSRFADMNYARAYRIATTEASKAWSFAEMESARIMEESGFSMLKEWLLGPLHPRYDLCDDNAQAGGIPIHQTFPSGDMATPQHPSCGCGIITYPDPGVRQPWGTTVLGQIPFLPWPNSNEVNNAA
jgi:hypothetical protein